MATSMKDALQGANVMRKPQQQKGGKKNFGKKPAPRKSQIMHGHVKWFDVKKGYGFILGDDDNEYFIHFSGIENGRHYVGLDQDDEVTFALIADRQGRPQATDVNMILPDANEADEDTDEVGEDTNEVSEAADTDETDEYETAYSDSEYTSGDDCSPE